MKKKLSWKTTLGGTLTSTGVVMMGAGALDWMNNTLRTIFMVTGFVFTVFGTFIGGLFARDNDVTSEEAGAKPKE